MMTQRTLDACHQRVPDFRALMPRGIWKGTLGFGLVSIGVELFTAEAPQSLDLDLLDRRDHAPIGYKKFNKQTGDEVSTDDIVKGFAVSKGQYVILSADDLTAANPHATQSIDIQGFVSADEIDLVYFDKPYVVGPLEGSEKAYALFVRTLEESRRVGIAQVVIRTKQHPAAIYPWRGALVAQLLRYHDEVRQPAQLGVTPPERTLAKQELVMAAQLVEMMVTAWQPETFRDQYREDVMRLVEERAARPDGTTAVETAPASADAPRILDLVAALKGSLAAKARDSVARGAMAAKRPRKAVATPAKSEKAAATKRTPRKKRA